MCGRFEIHSTLDIIARIFQISNLIFDVKPNYNIAPSQDVAVVTNDGRKNIFKACRWGFVPSWSKELKTGYRMINARAETVAVNRTFRDAFLNTRCLVPADGFFHWKKEGKTKSPFYIRLKSGNPMGLAGLYNNWRSPEGEEVCTFTIITTDANDLLSSIHPRMPVIIPEEDHRLWLDPAVHDEEALLALLRPYPSDEMEYYPVTPKVNSFKYNDPENIKPVAA
jgi:putative SOS response-associated peptidase YedK